MRVLIPDSCVVIYCGQDGDGTHEFAVLDEFGEELLVMTFGADEVMPADLEMLVRLDENSTIH